MSVSFLFFGALLALPLVSIPVVLHLLFQKRSPVLHFSTTRFIRSTLQRTATRRLLQKWLLLITRVLVVLMLILTAAQPVLRVANPSGVNNPSIAAIVVDTSYSMQFTRDQESLLEKATRIIQDLLRNELSESRVAIFTSQPRVSSEMLKPASERLSEGISIQPQGGLEPLCDRITAAMRYLDQQNASSKWLVILTDMQAREFPRSPDVWKGGNKVVFDLQPDDVRSSGIRQIRLDPDQPIPRIVVDAIMRLAGPPGESRTVTAQILTVDGRTLVTSTPRLVRFETSDETEIRIPIQLPAGEPFLVLRGTIDGEDELMWDNDRQIVFQMPTRRQVRILTSSEPTPSERVVALAMDPNEGRSEDWPLKVQFGSEVSKDDDVVVCLLNTWPDRSFIEQLKQASARGTTLVLMLRPGLQETWDKLSPDHREALRPLLPGEPMIDPQADRPHYATLPPSPSPLVKELSHEQFQLSSLLVQRMVTLSPSAQAMPLVMALLRTDGPGHGLVYRHLLNGSAIYTFTTWPDKPFSNLSIHPAFVPMIVRCGLEETTSWTVQNVELGSILKINHPESDRLTVTTSSGEPFTLDRLQEGEFRFDRAALPGLYRWAGSDGTIVGVSNVQIPAAEALTTYREPSSVIPGEDVLVARTLEGFRQQRLTANQPVPRWSGLIASVLLLMCVESFFGNNAWWWRLFPDQDIRFSDWKFKR
ncbi:MAG: hypothetical protein KatS3mg104_0422 [Phycisphaerae bacterium]|nr:MAG: hypothetical protein KatS3mg104_0422 [Phycisphaerae bacterium]